MGKEKPTKVGDVELGSLTRYEFVAKKTNIMPIIKTSTENGKARLGRL